MAVRLQGEGVQVVGYRPRVEDAAALLIADEGAVETIRLTPGRSLSYALDARHCAGVVDGESHDACDDADAPYCPVHTDRWPCARCTGDCDLPIRNCHEEHALYLAAFAPSSFKVGVTKSQRLERRWREQGADRAAHLRTVANGRVAREIEAEIAARVGDRVRVETKVAGLHETVDEDAWASLLADFEPVETARFDYGLDLTGSPIPETLATGTVVGTKGRVLVIENGGTTYAVDLRDLVGYELTEEATERSLQASLGSFG